MGCLTKRKCLKGQCKEKRELTVTSYWLLLITFLISALSLLRRVPYAVSHFSKDISAPSSFWMTSGCVQSEGFSGRDIPAETPPCRCFICFRDGLTYLISHTSSPPIRCCTAKVRSTGQRSLCCRRALCFMCLIVMCVIFWSNLIALLPARNPKIHQMYKIISVNDLKQQQQQ